MPFPQQTARAFTLANVEALNPNQAGCYGLFVNQGGWVYVGKAKCIRTRLLEHLRGDNVDIANARPTHWVDVVTADMDNEERRLILELKPSCNKKVG